MENLTGIRIKIADREYGLRIAPEDEPLLKKASDLLNAALKIKKDEVRVYDKVDLLAMVAFDLIVEKLQAENTQRAVNEQLDALQNRIDNVLQEDISQ
jgi:cell division protein ZapA